MNLKASDLSHSLPPLCWIIAFAEIGILALPIITSKKQLQLYFSSNPRKIPGALFPFYPGNSHVRVKQKPFPTFEITPHLWLSASTHYGIWTLRNHLVPEERSENLIQSRFDLLQFLGQDLENLVLVLFGHLIDFDIVTGFHLMDKGMAS
jgi:hypothetical protein